jgi:osmotically-inducible protein OsmY
MRNRMARVAVLTGGMWLVFSVAEASAQSMGSSGGSSGGSSAGGSSAGGSSAGGSSSAGGQAIGSSSQSFFSDQNSNLSGQATNGNLSATTTTKNTNSASTNGVSSSNSFAVTYRNVYGIGLGGQVNSTFGQPTYVVSTSSGTTSGGASGRSGTTGTTRGGASASSTASITTRKNSGTIPPVLTGTTSRRPAYAATTVFEARSPQMTQVMTDLRGMLDRSSQISKPDTVHLDVDGGTVVLSGTVANEREARLVEGMVRLTPGVHSIRNELTPRNLTASSQQ